MGLKPRAYDGVSHDMQGKTGIADGEHNANIIWPNVRRLDSEVTSRQNHAAPGELVAPIATHISDPPNYGDNAGMNSRITTDQVPVNVFNSAEADTDGKRRGAEARRKKPPEFKCPRVSCGRAFTTKYRLTSEYIPCTPAYTAANATYSAHWNRFHAAPESQQRFPCGNGDCDYITFYSTDLPRHRKTCKGRQLSHPEFNFNFPAEPAFDFNFRG